MINNRVLLLSLLAVLFSFACSRAPKSGAVQASSKPAKAPVIEVAAAQSRRLERSISVTGSLVADEVVTVSPEVAGRVRR